MLRVESALLILTDADSYCNHPIVDLLLDTVNREKMKNAPLSQTVNPRSEEDLELMGVISQL